MSGTVLETERLLLREWDESDVPAFLVLCGDPRVVHFIHTPPLTGLDDAREKLRAGPLADYAKHGFGRWACVRKATGQVIGFCGLKRVEELGEVDVGYGFLPAHWGVGLATEAGRASLDDGFTRLGLRRIIGLVVAEHVASRRVLEKLGLREDGTVEHRGMTPLRYVIET